MSLFAGCVSKGQQRGKRFGVKGERILDPLVFAQVGDGVKGCRSLMCVKPINECAQDLIEFRLSIETGLLNEMIGNNLMKERKIERVKERERGRKTERKQRQKDMQPIYRTSFAFSFAL